MLKNVSWSDYATIMGILLVSYYFYIGVRYYRKEIAAFLKGKINKKDNTAAKQGKPAGQALAEKDFEELEVVVNDLRYGILDRAGRRADKAQLLGLLLERLGKYEGLRKPAYRAAINNYIMQHAKEICGVAFSEEELNAAWDTLPR